MCQTLSQSHASKGRLFSELTHFKESRDAALDNLRLLENRADVENENENVAKFEKMRGLLAMHTDMAMNPFFNNKRECCQPKQAEAEEIQKKVG